MEGPVWSQVSPEQNSSASKEGAEGINLGRQLMGSSAVEEHLSEFTIHREDVYPIGV